MKLIILALFLTSCGMTIPNVNTKPNGGNGDTTTTPDPTPTPTVTPTPTPTVTPTPTPTPVVVVTPQIRPCVLVEETNFTTLDKLEPWFPSYYYNAPAQYPLSLEKDVGVVFSGGSGYRSGITLDLKNHDVSMCPSLAFRLQGTINLQSLSGAGYDNREAPLAVMIQYTDSKGVKHNTLTAFNEGEPNDNATTRMYWWGFGYLNPAYNFGFNFTPSITPVEQSVKFDKTSEDLMKKLDIKIIHTITIEASGWSLDSSLQQFSMKPLEAFVDPDAPYRNGPMVQPIQPTAP